MNKKMLVAYFSVSGNTKIIAEKIQKQTGADIFRIETKIPYPEDYNDLAYNVAKKQHEENIKPELKENIDISQYDVIFIGTPAWWYEMAPAIKTFLCENDFKNKTIVPFVTHGGGGEYSIVRDIAQYAKDSKVTKSYTVYENGDSDTDTELKNFLQAIM